MLTPEQVTMLKSVNVEVFEKDKLADVSKLQLDYSLPDNKRMTYILEHVRNPYCFRYKDVGVKLEFSQNGKSLNHVMEDFLIRQKCGL